MTIEFSAPVEAPVDLVVSEILYKLQLGPGLLNGLYN